MRKSVFLFQFFIISLVGFAQSFDTVLLRDNGPSDKCINFVVLGDGYDMDEQDVFMVDATELVDYFFTIPAFSNYSEYFNVFVINVIYLECVVEYSEQVKDVYSV